MRVVNVGKLVMTGILGIFLASTMGAAWTDEETKEEKKQAWDKAHPRRHEVNARLANQNRRIHQGVKSGELTEDQAKQLHQEDHSIRTEEQQDAAENNGHITKSEQHELNQEENATSKQIYSEKHPE